MFVQRGNAIGVALLAALLGRFLPRLGPLRATEAASFFFGTRHCEPEGSEGEAIQGHWIASSLRSSR